MDPMVEPRRLSETYLVQNPALGAALLATFGRAFQDSVSAAPSLLLHQFLILPICFHRKSAELASKTNPSSGLGKFCEKISANREDLFAVHERALALRKATLESLAFGLRAKLVALNYDSATVRALQAAPQPKTQSATTMFKAASRLGIWFRDVDIVQTYKALRVSA